MSIEKEHARGCVQFNIAVDPVTVGALLDQLARARDRVVDIEDQLRDLRGERCAHWVDGPGGSRIPVPVFGCRYC